ncbi:stage V sporulation T C-terminal domain-containing protein [Phosphitispora sp. TUW77]|uniref:stage V sporulation T C-terminal domain-containing protein n=1 Tax=Phosphitispora sp. TUW77 TaxID=3152361 RepID=UPI003AB4BC2B
MSDIGIVRRMDDLGRMVIPKEIRRNLRFKNGDPLEIFIDKNAIVFRKYDPTPDPLDSQADNIAKVLSESLEGQALITREDMVISAPGNKSLLKKNLSENIYDKLKNGESYFGNEGEELLEGWDTKTNFICTPLTHEGNVTGSVILLKDKPSNVEEKVILAMTDFLEKQYLPSI